MRPNGFLGLLLATLVAVAAAAAVLLTGSETRVDTAAGEPAFPLLRSAPERVETVTVTAKGQSFTLLKGEGGRWAVQETGGYPADRSQIRLLLQGLAKLTLYQPKTALPERLPRLWLGDPEAADSKSVRIEVSDATGELMADAVFGRSSNDLLGTVEGGVYLRFGEETQSWLAAGRLPLPQSPLDLLDRSIVSLPDDTVRRVSTTHPDGTVILAERARGEPALTVKTGLPEGRAADPRALQRLASLVDTLLFEDVRPSRDLAFPAETLRTTVTSFDGIQLQFELARVDGAPWLRLNARLAEDHTDNPDHLAGAEGFIAKLQDKVGGWSYRVGEKTWQRLAVTPESLLP